MKIDFEKSGGLVPAIIQDAKTKNVLMLGYMNQEAYDKTIATKKVTFWSRSRNCLWTKGETSGNFLHLVDIMVDCDNDTLLVKANPDGPTCHTGTDTCWGEENKANPLLFLTELQDFINTRHCDRGLYWYQRAAVLRSGRHDLSPHRAACQQEHAYRGYRR